MRSFVAVISVLLLSSCQFPGEVDSFAPSAPRGIRTTSLDNAVELRWLSNTEPDVAGYNIWQSDRYDGRYELIGSTSSTRFTDRSARNGVTRYYAVSAFDGASNESELSTDVVYDTPRPEGYGVVLPCAVHQPLVAGYDFSSYSVGPYNDQYTDFYFDIVQGRLVLRVWDDTDIQGLGYTADLDEISVAPTSGWSPSGSAEVIAGHTYVVWTWDDHYAKVRVREVSAARIVFDWAYQTATGNTELRVEKPVPRKRPTLRLHTGTSGR